jgi:hypothetical protein
MTEHLGKGLGTTLEGERIGRERFGIRRLRFGAQHGRTLRDEREKGAHQVRWTVMAEGECRRIAEERANRLMQGGVVIATLRRTVMSLPVTSLAGHPSRARGLGRGEVERAVVTD